MKNSLLLLALSALFSCVSPKTVVTDGYFESADTIYCLNDLPQDVFVWRNSEPFPNEFEEVGVIELNGREPNGKQIEQAKVQESLLNLALLMAWDNCADGIIEVQKSYNSFSAIAVRTKNPALVKRTYPQLYKSGFVAFVENEQQQNEMVRMAKEERKAGFADVGWSLATLVILALLNQ